jgi:hypothetical protein
MILAQSMNNEGLEPGAIIGVVARCANKVFTTRRDSDTGLYPAQPFTCFTFFIQLKAVQRAILKYIDIPPDFMTGFFRKACRAEASPGDAELPGTDRIGPKLE